MNIKLKILFLLLILLFVYGQATACGPHEHTNNGTNVKEEPQPACETKSIALGDLCEGRLYCDINCKDTYNGNHKHTCCSDSNNHNENKSNYIITASSADQFQTARYGSKNQQNINDITKSFPKEILIYQTASIPKYITTGSLLI